MDEVRQILFVPPAPLVWADARKTFADRSLAVKTTQTLSSDQIGKGLAAGEWDVGIGVMDNIVAWNDLFGADLVILAQLERRMLLRFCASADCGSLADAAAAPIAVDATTNGFVLVLFRALAQAGIDWRACCYDEVGGVRHRFEAMMNATARSTILVPPFDAMAEERGCKVLWSVDDIAPAYPGVVVAAPRAWVATHHDLARRYVAALRAANAWAGAPANREAAEAALVAARYAPAAAALLVRDIVPDLRPSQAGWDETIALRAECGLLPAGFAGSVIDAQFIPD